LVRHCSSKKWRRGEEGGEGGGKGLSKEGGDVREKHTRLSLNPESFVKSVEGKGIKREKGKVAGKVRG